MWDKLPHAIAESSEPRIELQSSRHNKRLNQLEGQKRLLALGPESLQLFDRLMSRMRDIDYLRAYRDAETHRHAHPCAEVFGVYAEDELLTEIWSALQGEWSRCKESLLATVALVLVRSA